MKRITKPPQPPPPPRSASSSPRAVPNAPPSSGRRVGVAAAPPPLTVPLPSARGRSIEDDDDDEDNDQQQTVQLPEELLAEHRALHRELAHAEGRALVTDEFEDAPASRRPQAPTLPLMQTPPVEWEATPALETPTQPTPFQPNRARPGPPRPPPPLQQHHQPRPTPPPSQRVVEASLQQQIWTDLNREQQLQHQHQQQQQQHHHHQVWPTPPESSRVQQHPQHPHQQHQQHQQQHQHQQQPQMLPDPSGSYPSGVSAGSQVFAVPPPPATPSTAPPEGMPLIYIIASAFFLAIAVVGFSLYLAYEVISL